jgi:hypothetical protein
MRIAKRTATRIAILAVSASHASRLSGWSGARTSEPRSADTVEAVHQFRESGRPSARIERQQNSFIRLRDNRYRLDLAQPDSFAGDLVDVPDDRLRQLWFLDRAANISIVRQVLPIRLRVRGRFGTIAEGAQFQHQAETPLPCGPLAV